MFIYERRHVKEFSLMPILTAFWQGALHLNNKVNFQPLLENKELQLSLRHQQILLDNNQGVLSDIPFLCFTDSNYPIELQRIPFMPPVLFYRGNLSLLQRRKVAIIGSRYCSERAKKITHCLSSTIGSGGHVTISGLAFGIDEIAHRANLRNSIGIVPFGFKAKSTSRHQKLCHDILNAGGLLLSEFPLHQPAQRWTFLQRNRIISGLSECVVITEARKKSGSLNTAKHALEQKKEVFTIPWDPLHKDGDGCRLLLQQGVVPILDLTEWSEIWGILSYLEIPQSIEQLIILTNQTHSNVFQSLLLLLKAQKITRRYDGKYEKID